MGTVAKKITVEIEVGSDTAEQMAFLLKQVNAGRSPSDPEYRTAAALAQELIASACAGEALWRPRHLDS